MRDLLDEVIGWFRQHPGHEQLRELFAELIRESLVARGVTVSDDLLEIRAMKTGFSRNVEEWYQQFHAEGFADGKAQGIAEGKVEGKAEGMAKALLCLLAARFGALTPSLRKRISRARLATVERWFKRAIVAPDLPSVFAERHP